MPTNDYLPVGTGVGANVDTQANFAGSGYQTTGFSVGVANPAQANKVWRQASMVAAAVTGFIAQQLGINIADDGNLAGLIANLVAALSSLVTASGAIVNVPYSANPVFNASVGSKFEVVLGGNCAPSLINTASGQTITVYVKQGGAGGYAFTPPANLPMDPVDPAAGKVSVQKFDVLLDGSLIPVTPLMSQ